MSDSERPDASSEVPADPRPDPRPAPRWGQYAEVPPPPPPLPPAVTDLPPPLAPAPPAPRLVGDIVITTVLLAIGVYDVVSRWSLNLDLASIIRQVYDLQGIGEFTSVGLAEQVGALTNVVRLAVLVGTIAWALVRINAGKRAFWVPLLGGVLATVTTFVFYLVVVISDPAFLSYVDQVSGG